jgi:hypothetical protein
MSDVARELADLLADAAERRHRGEPVNNRTMEAARLATELGAGADPAAFDRFFELLAEQLKSRRVRLPPLDELPPSVVPLVAAFGNTVTLDENGQVDFERSATRAQRVIRNAVGASPRDFRRTQQRATIRRNVSASVAEALRRNGLVPACDDEEHE